MSTSLERIDIDKETLGHALIDRRLDVPKNQRSYAWEEEHVTDLYKDLAGEINAGNPEYFLGSIVAVATGDGHVEINDGQQRLATTAILLAAIRDFFDKIGDTKTARLIEERYLFETDIETHEITAKLHLNAEDHGYFERRVLQAPSNPDRIAAKKETPIKPSHKRIAKAAQLAAKHVSQVVSTVHQSDKANQLHKWRKFLETGARVIWVEVSDRRTAYFIFETMNDRGLKLSAADLLKNHILAQAADREIDAYQKWIAMSSLLDRLNEQEDAVVNYIRYLWIAKNGPVRSRDLYDKIKVSVRNKTTALELATEIETRASDYVALLSSSDERWAQHSPSVRRQIDTLNNLGVKQIRPLLLAAIQKFTAKELTKLLTASVNWCVRYLISGVGPGTLEGFHGRSAMKIGKGEITSVGQLATEMLEVIPSNDKFKSAFVNANVSRADLARYYLRAMQMHVDGKEEEYLPNEEITREHIMPENPQGKWKHVPTDILKTNFQRIGNQVLLTGTVNSALGNTEYVDKQPVLLASEFSLTRDAAVYTSWGLEEIAKRQVALAELAVKTWPIIPR
jgi:Protein of unknown function DUF262/Protein of unknown function (DUF1524)